METGVTYAYNKQNLFNLQQELLLMDQDLRK